MKRNTRNCSETTKHLSLKAYEKYWRNMLIGWLLAILVIGLICGILIGDVVYGILYIGMICFALCYLPIVTPLSLINLHRVKTAYGKPLLYGEIIETASGYHRQTLFVSKNPILCKQAYQGSEGNNVAMNDEYVCYAERLGGGTYLYCRYKATAVAGNDHVYIISWENPGQGSP